jgi:hypothetical protein
MSWDIGPAHPRRTFLTHTVDSHIEVFAMLNALQRNVKRVGVTTGLAATAMAPLARFTGATFAARLAPATLRSASAAAAAPSAKAATGAAARVFSSAPRSSFDTDSRGKVYDFNQKYRPRFGKNASPRVRVKLDDVLSSFLDQQQVPTAESVLFEHIACPPEFDAPVARLSPGLIPAVTTPGVSSTAPIDQLPRVNFPDHIYQPDEIRWDLIPPFITASRDPVLLDLVASNGGRFFGSTSSCSPVLSQISFAITSFMPVQVPQLSQWFSYMPRTHTRAAVKPSCNVLRRRRRAPLTPASDATVDSTAAAVGPGTASALSAGGVVAARDASLWGVDNFPVGSPKRNQILIDLGKSLERQLTMDPDEFVRTHVIPRNDAGELIPPTEEELAASAAAMSSKDLREAYRFVKSGSLVLRSQLDCYDESVAGEKKVFDLKTRAVLPIRLDVENHEDYLSYSIERKEGVYSSFEREWYDMARAAFLKYSFQCRIGDMGGIFVGYHNTARLFGFQYISLAEMDSALYGSTSLAQAVYEQAVRLLEETLQRVVDDCVVSAGCDHDAIRVTVRAFSNRFEVFTETLPPLPQGAERTSDAIEAVLLDLHAGAMYVDQLSEEELRAALGRRNAKTTGSRAELCARLEDLVAAADGVYSVPPVDYLVSRVAGDHIRMYTVGLDVLVNGSPRVALTSFSDIDKLHTLFQFKRVVDHSVEDVAHAYAEALTEWMLREEDRPEAVDAEVADAAAAAAAAANADGSAMHEGGLISPHAATVIGRVGSVVSTVTEADEQGQNVTKTTYDDGSTSIIVTDKEGVVISSSNVPSPAIAETAAEAAAFAAARKSNRKIQAERILRERAQLEKYFEGEQGGMSPEMLLTLQRKRALEQTSRGRVSRKVM